MKRNESRRQLTVSRFSDAAVFKDLGDPASAPALAHLEACHQSSPLASQLHGGDKSFSLI